MTDTVTRLMELAQEWADQEANISDPLNTHEEFELSLNKAKAAKQALHDELVRLFTPLSDEQITKALVKTYKGGHHAFAREVESCHGIGGES